LLKIIDTSNVLGKKNIYVIAIASTIVLYNAFATVYFFNTFVMPNKNMTLPKARLLQLQLNIDEFDHESALPIADRQLLFRAKEAADEAYAPYSNFRVGAAILLANGDIVTGSNQENAAYSMCLCAERTALAAASYLYPNIAVVALAVTAKTFNAVLQSPVPPCGACRQVIAETESRYQQAIKIIMRGETGVIWRIASVKEILPLAFDSTFL
jgi:cytidine deaminase